MSLSDKENNYLCKNLGREPNQLERQIVAAEWSEHCSYKSSKIHLKSFPKGGDRVLVGKGYDSGILDVGNGFVITIHIESHNHPSAVEPYGGAATGVGGILRDIFSMGTRPIAVLDGLRFGNIKFDSNARWLFKNAVRGIADYGNCLGIPTVAGDVEFDECFRNYALVDVASIGYGKKDSLIKNEAFAGDFVVLLGGATGRDGIGGSQFASDKLEEENRSAVQIPDPFIEKLVMEAILEARKKDCIRAMKDLGGGGLSCAISETADALGVGIDLDLSKVHTREKSMTPEEIMVSESQERMLLVIPKSQIQTLEEICSKYNVPFSVIGTVTEDNTMRVHAGNGELVSLPCSLVANAPLLSRPSQKPSYLEKMQQVEKPKVQSEQLSDIVLKMMENPNIASKSWVYQQYDSEVGIRTVVKPGSDAAVLRLDDGKFISVKIDGNSKHCYVNPYKGTLGCFEEACRNVVCTGATPIGAVDHLQFGNPEDPEIFWTFQESVRAISDYAKYTDIPIVGGKVSFYNEAEYGPIKPTPLIGAVGLVDNKSAEDVDSSLSYLRSRPSEEDKIIIVGITKDELGGSEYYEYIHGITGGNCPDVDLESSKRNMKAVIDLIRKNHVNAVHDCSKGGIATSISELCVYNNMGCRLDLESIPADSKAATNDKKEDSQKNNGLGQDELLFSESNSRYILAVDKDTVGEVESFLQTSDVAFSTVGEFGGSNIVFCSGDRNLVDLRIDIVQSRWKGSVGELMR